MTTSTSEPQRAYVWVWLPGAPQPVPAGLIRRRGQQCQFAYGRGYLERPDAISLYTPELPLQDGWMTPSGNMEIASCLRDAGPDSWGQRIILARLTGIVGREADPGDIDQLTYFLESGSNRIGGLDFQQDPRDYVAREDDTVTLAQMILAADHLQRGEPLTKSVDLALLHGTSVGGARPKVLIRDGDTEMIAKLTTSTDTWPEVAGEAACSDLARQAGLDVPQSRIVRVDGRRVLLIERFDRIAGGQRRLVVSGLTMLGLSEMEARYATYPDLLDRLQTDGDDAHVGRRLFERIAFNIAIGNSDDHARNHAAFWDGQRLSLTPAYDLTPQVRSGETSAQAMAYGRDGERASSFESLRRCAAVYGLTPAQGREIVDRIVTTIEEGWDDAADRAELSEVERSLLFGRAVLNRSVSYRIPPPVSSAHGRVRRGSPGGSQFSGRERGEPTIDL